jgi:hypothetical protein
VAFNAFIASCTIFLNISYAFPILILNIRGRKILIQHQSPTTPWKLGNRLGPTLNWVAVLYVLVTSVVSLLAEPRIFRIEAINVYDLVFLLPSCLACDIEFNEYVSRVLRSWGQSSH